MCFILINVPWSLKRMYILSLLNGIVHKSQLDLVDWWCCQFNHILTDFLPTESVNYWRRVLKFSVTTVDLSIFHCIFCLTCFDALFFGACTLRMVMSAGKTDPFSKMQYHALSSVISLAPKSVLLEINTADPNFLRLLLT